MNKLFIVLTVILGLGVIGAGVYAFMVMGERDDIQKELATTQETLNSTQQELNTSQENLNATTNELAMTQDSLDSTLATLDSTEDTLDNTAKQLAVTEDNLKVTKEELSNTKEELDDTKTDLNMESIKLESARQDLEELEGKYDVAMETLSGLDITISSSSQCYDVNLIDNPEATNPTWAKLRQFLAQDLTEQHEYILDEYDCSQFSRDLHNRAEAAGIRAAEVHISFKGEETGHALNAFLTTDYGLVYIDSTLDPDKAARIISGLVYRAVAIHSVSITNIRNDYWWNAQLIYYYMANSKGGQSEISSIRIFW